jgi:HSP20 family protein
MAEVKTNTTQDTTSKQNSPNQQVARRSSSGGLAQRGFDPFLLSPREFFSASPFALMRRMTEEMDRVFGEFGFGQGQAGSGTGAWAPAIEVAQRGGNYLVHAELPGLKPEDVKVEVTDDALVIQGERKWEQEANQGGVQRSERHYGQFYRSIPLPEGVNAEQVRAKFQNGVLEVTVPLPQTQSNRRQITVETGEPANSGTTIESSRAAKA